MSGVAVELRLFQFLLALAESLIDPMTMAKKFKDVISDASLEDRLILAKLLDTASSDPDLLREQLRSKSRTLWQKISGRDVTYIELLQKVGDAHKMQKRIWESNRDFERRIVRTFFKHAQSQLIPSTRKAYHAEAIATVSIAAAQASGFGVYQMATTVMGMASSAAGVTIPFIGYMALTKAIFLTIGPLGWAAIGVSALHKITKPDYSKMIAVIAWMFAVRDQVDPQRTLGNYSITEIMRKVVKLLIVAVPAALLITTVTNTEKPIVTSNPPAPAAISMNPTEISPASGPTETYQDSTTQIGEPNHESADNGLQDQNTAITATISGWASALAQNDATMAASYYAANVDRYFLKRNVTREFIRTYKQSLIESGKRLYMFSARDLQFESSSPEAATVSLIKYWMLLDGSATTMTQRRTRSRLWLKRTPEGWKITGEQDLK